MWTIWSGGSTWMILLAVALVAVAATLLIHRLGRSLIFRLVRFSVVLTAVAQRCQRPAQLLLPVVVLQMVWHGAPNDLPFIGGVRHGNGLLLIAALTWLATAAVKGVANGVIALHPSDVADNLNARRIHTQARVLSRIAMGGLYVVGISFMLMTFPGARQLGGSLLASAGVVGLVAGIAARPVFGNLIAGLQIALSQPLRIWDERRLIIPLQWFVENPFQNWTRTSADLIGSVFLWVDYTLPLEPLRREAERLCEQSADWDSRLCKLQVTEGSERGMQLRVLVTAASSGQCWDLRCEVREGLIDFIQREYPHALPQVRAREPARPSDASSAHSETWTRLPPTVV